MSTDDKPCDLRHNRITTQHFGGIQHRRRPFRKELTLFRIPNVPVVIDILRMVDYLSFFLFFVFFLLLEGGGG